MPAKQQEKKKGAEKTGDAATEGAEKVAKGTKKGAKKAGQVVTGDTK
jgi:hypothetical protein